MARTVHLPLTVTAALTAAWFFVALPALAATESSKNATAVVETGRLAGQVVGSVVIYKNVPFAAPPIGALRWAPPQSAKPWAGVRDATAYGPACPQKINPDGRPNAGGYVGPTSEDCLTLNIFAPILTHLSARKAPVMVWIYGGGNTAGANSLPSTDGRAFARDGVIVVEVAYRIGALGFFAHPTLTRAAGAFEPLGSYGIMDQIAALKWVRRNIAAFGGDPENVTIFGESAGGADVLTLMAAPAARGLFQKAAVQSGGGWSAPYSLAQAETDGAATTTRLGLPVDATLDQLRALPVESIVRAQGRAEPIIDGRLLTQTATQAFARGRAARVPLLIGSNSYEASLLGPAAPDISNVPPTLRGLFLGSSTVDRVRSDAVVTDSIMGAPARWIAARTSARPRSWLYYFSYVRVVRRGRLPGANHASEIPYVFDSQALVPNYAAEITDEDRAMAKVVHSCWVAFAKTSVPTCIGAPAWPTYSRSADQLMEFGPSMGVHEHPRRDQLDTIEAFRNPR